MGTTANDLTGRISLYLNQSVSLLLNIISPKLKYSGWWNFPSLLVARYFLVNFIYRIKKMTTKLYFQTTFTFKNNNWDCKITTPERKLWSYGLAYSYLQFFDQGFFPFLRAIVWNYNTNRFKNSFMKFYWIWYDFGVDRDSLQRKKRNIFHYQTTKWWKFDSCFYYL